MAWSVSMGSVSLLQGEHDCRPITRPEDSIKRQSLNPAQKTETDDEDILMGLEKKRRLNADQVNYLEANFSMDLKLEPERKVLLAKYLGIRPRQVAIWFQNRRARWKNQQLEQDFENLKKSYESVVKEKERLLKEYDSAKESNKRLQAEVARLSGSLQSFERNGITEAREDQPSTGKSEVMSTSKSGNDASEIQDSGQSYQTVPETVMVVTPNLRLEQPRSDSLAEFKPEVPNFLFSDCNPSGFPMLFQHAIAKGYCPDNEYNVIYEWEKHLNGFAW